MLKIKLIFLILQLILPMVMLKNCGVYNTPCFENKDCCSNNCTSLVSNNISICTKNLKKNLTLKSRIKRNSCTSGGKVCLRNNNCCSNLCIQPSYNLMGYCLGSRKNY